MDFGPKRIVCLTEETTETLYLLGVEDRIVGVSGFTVRPKHARKEKPTVSTFLDAKIDDILALKPDLVIGFSDIQANIAKELIEKGIAVWVNNYRSVQGILEMMVQLGALVNKKEAALALVHRAQENMTKFTVESKTWEVKPRVYFEEWFDPLITGIAWVGELIEIAGGIDIFKDKRGSLAKDRILKDFDTVIQRNPDIILASWCGKTFKKKKLLERAGSQRIKAVLKDDIHEIKSSVILQPGPAALFDGLPQLHQIFLNWQKKNG